MNKFKNKFKSLKLQLSIAELLQQRAGLPTFRCKLKNGEAVTIGFLGGSITLADGYRPWVTELLQADYPQSKITGINAGIGGTGSSLGVFRLNDDIISHNPDLVFIEFAVNDCDITPEQSLAATEGIVRQLRSFNPTIDICFIYTIRPSIKAAIEAGKQPWTIAIMEKIAEHYNIPSINLGPEVVAQEKIGNLIYQLPRDSAAVDDAENKGQLVFSHDAVHPTLDDGHGLYSKIIMTAMAELFATNSTISTVLPVTTLASTPWSRAKMLPLQAEQLSAEWQQTTPVDEKFEQIESIQRLNKLWKATQPGAEIKFSFTGTAFGLFGIFGLNSGQFKVWIDDVEYPAIALFDKYSNFYRVHYVMVAGNLPDRKHTVRLRLDEQPPDRTILLPERQIDDPEKLVGVVAYLGSLLILGEL